jgi:ribosomal protein S4
MIFKKRSQFKPLYKQFINLRENVQDRKKLLQFKKQKWSQLINNSKRKLKRYRKFKPKDQTQYIVSRYPNRGTSYKTSRYRNTLQTYKKFKLFYGGFTRKKIKFFVKKTLEKKGGDKNLLFLKFFESRLDTILYRAKFSTSIRNARQLIVHGKVLVNNNRVKSQSYVLKSGDLISIYFKHRQLIEKNIACSNTWPIPPKHLIINYKTLQIIFGTMDKVNVSTSYHFNLNLEKLLVDYLQH